MSNQSPTEPVHDVTGRTLDLGAEARRAWGPKWGAPEVEYRFGDGREFVRRTEESAIYQPQS